MFRDAISQATQFTRPIIISRLGYDGKCSSVIGAYVVLNPDGWIATAWHVLEFHPKLSASKTTCLQYDRALAKIEGNQTLNRAQRKQALRALPKREDSWTRDFSFFFGYNNVSMSDDIIALPAADLAIVRLHGFKPEWVPSYPVFRNPGTALKVGTSLCKLGFPFYRIEPTYDQGAFTLPPGSIPPPFFPIEGMATRNILRGQSPLGYTIGFVEISSPGLRGQSGGPIFDRDGIVWGIQSQTAHYPLGFNPPVPGSKKGEVEHQFLNVGLGVHVETIVGFLREHGIAHQMTDT